MKKTLSAFIFFCVIILTIFMFMFYSTSLNISKNDLNDIEELEIEEINDIVMSQNVVSSTFNVGNGKEWPSSVFAPFVDITAWTTKTGYGINGALDLGKIYEETGILYYNLAFVNYNPNSSGFITKDEKTMIDWCFGGYSILSEHNSDDWQYEGIKQSIKNIRDYGGDVAISFGGGREMNFFQKTTDIDILVNTYLDIIYGFGLTKIDLDIEGNAQNQIQNEANAKALKIVQDETNVKITLTLPVFPTGLTNVGLAILNTYLEEGVDIDMVNVMAMCYGESYLLKNESYGESTVRAAISTKNQIQDSYKEILGINLSDEESYKKTATTISIGKESSIYPIYTTDWAEIMYDFAVDKKMGMLSFWSLNRDCMTIRNSGIYYQYSFSDVYKNYIEDTDEIMDTVIIDEIDSIDIIGNTYDNESNLNNEEEVTLESIYDDTIGPIISFDSKGGSKVDYITNDTDLVYTSIVPTKYGYNFMGWYVNEEYTQEYDFSTPITEDITLYAKWEPNLEEQNIIAVATFGIVLGIIGLVCISIMFAFHKKKRKY